MAGRIRMVPFDSSSIAAGGYDGEERILRLRCIDGDTYDYLDVPSSVFQTLLDAPSKGQFVNWHIKPDYAYRRVKPNRPSPV
jgi:hypothetical protein